MTLEPIPAPVNAVVEAINSADTEAFVAAFTADGYVDDWGRVLRGPEGVRSWAHTDAIGAGASMEILQSVTQGPVTQLRFRWTSNVFNGESTAIVTVEGDKVASFRIPPHA